jgi:hypothetical protein
MSDSNVSSYGASPYLSGAGTAMSAVGSIMSGNAAAAAGKSQQIAENYQATELRQQAGQDRAVSQVAAINANRTTAFTMSRERALAAASGGGASDPTIIRNEAGIQAQGSYNALTALATGEERARGQETQANAAQYQGAEYAARGQGEQTAGYIKGISTALTGAGSLYDKYGPKGGGATVDSSDYSATRYGYGGAIGRGYGYS